MADDPTQRPYRSNETLARATPARPQSSPQGGSSGSDPLAELARLIGQNDPFAEYGRDTSHGVAAPRLEPRQLEARQPEPRQADRPPEWLSQPAGFAPPRAPAPAAQAPEYYDQAPPPLAPTYGRQQFGGAPLASDADLYHVDNDAPGYPPAHAPSFADDQYSPRNPQLGAEQEDFYDDVPPSRRRMGILVIAGVFALAVIGTAGAFGYRAIFGTSSVSKVPPVIKADSAPSKVVPAATKDPQSGKQITDRINDKGMGEKLVSREEQPVGLSGSGTPQGQDQSGSTSAPAQGSGVVGSEPKKVRTIAIRPDQSGTVEAPAAPTPTASTSAPPRVTAPTPKPTVVQTTRVTNTPPPAAAAEDPEPAPAPRQAAPRATAASNNAPLSLNPDVTPARAAPARAATQPTRTAAVPAAQPQSAAVSGGSGGYAVQVSSQRSEAEAQAAFRSLQSKYPAQLGGKQSEIRRADLGAKGIYFRAVVPLSSSSEASELCNGLKAAGGSCIVQKN